MEQDKEQEQTKEQAEKDFEAGRAMARGNVMGEKPEHEQPEPEKTEPKEQPEESPAEPAEDREKLPAEPAESRFFGLTEDEVKTALGKAGELDDLKTSFNSEIRKLQGRYGEISGELKKLATTRQITRQSFKKLEQEYPEIADALTDDLGALTVGGITEPGNLAEEFNSRLNQTRVELAADFNRRLVNMARPDWLQKRNSPDWGLWKGTLPVEKRREYDSTIDADVAIRAIDEFDTWRNQGQGKKKKEDRLNRAMTPSGTAQEPAKKNLGAEAEFEAGRKAARKRLGLMR
jgi:hypothetical protein